MGERACLIMVLVLLSACIGHAPTAKTASTDASAAVDEIAAQSKRGSPPPDRKSVALVLGVEDYQGDLPTAQGAAWDAKNFARLAKDILGLQPRNIRLFVNERATKATVDAHIREWLPRVANKNGDVYVYFAGHGAPNPRNRKRYLVPWDATPKYLSTQGIALGRRIAGLPGGPWCPLSVSGWSPSPTWFFRGDGASRHRNEAQRSASHLPATPGAERSSSPTTLVVAHARARPRPRDSGRPGNFYGLPQSWAKCVRLLGFPTYGEHLDGVSRRGSSGRSARRLRGSRAKLDVVDRERASGNVRGFGAATEQLAKNFLE